MHPQFAPLFQPLRLNNGVLLKNRLAVAPMTHWASRPDGSISDAERLFLSGRAQDFGLFVTAATLVSPEGKAFAGEPYAFDDSHSDSLRQRAAIIRAQGAKAVLQIHHGGKNALKDLVPDGGLVAPSADEETGARELSADEIEGLVCAYARAARLAIGSGFDGVEIHGANGYLIQQFVSRQSNRRSDRWGEPAAFALAVIEAVLAEKQAAGRDDLIVGYRFSPEEAGDQGLTMADTLALVDVLAEQPLQYLHVSLWDFYKTARRGADTSRTRIELIHERIGGRLPLIGTGSLLTAEAALAACRTGWAELVGIGKAVMLNSDFATLILQGREAEIVCELDPERPDRYRIPDGLWQRCLKGYNWLPPLKGRPWRAPQA